MVCTNRYVSVRCLQISVIGPLPHRQQTVDQYRQPAAYRLPVGNSHVIEQSLKYCLVLTANRFEEIVANVVYV